MAVSPLHKVVQQIQSVIHSLDHYQAVTSDCILGEGETETVCFGVALLYIHSVMVKGQFFSISLMQHINLCYRCHSHVLQG